jgi:hypothetical protein
VLVLGRKTMMAATTKMVMSNVVAHCGQVEGGSSLVQGLTLVQVRVQHEQLQDTFIS